MFQFAWLRQPALKSSYVQQQPSCLATSNFLHCPYFCMLQSQNPTLKTCWLSSAKQNSHPKWTSGTVSTLWPLVLSVTSSSPFLPLTLEQPHHYSLDSKQPFSLDSWFVPFYYLDLSLPGMLFLTEQTSWPASMVSFPQAAMQKHFLSLTMIPLSAGRVWSSRWLWLPLHSQPLAAAAAFHPPLGCFPAPAHVGAGSRPSLGGPREQGVL